MCRLQMCKDFKLTDFTFTCSVIFQMFQLQLVQFVVSEILDYC